MTLPKTQTSIPLRKAGYDPKDVVAQVEKLCRSKAFDRLGNPQSLLRVLVNWALENDRPPTVREVYKLMNKPFNRGGSLVRNIRIKLIEVLDEHYASTEAQPDEIRLIVLQGKYLVYTPRPRRVRAVSANELHGLIGRVDVRISEPADMAEVYREVQVSGRIDELNADLRVWLVVYTNKGYFLQCRVSRKKREWQHEVRCGIGPLGAAEGTEFDILLVAADTDGDYAMFDHLSKQGPGHGLLRLPTDTWVLEKKHVIRRDIRPGASM